MSRMSRDGPQMTQPPTGSSCAAAQTTTAAAAASIAREQSLMCLSEPRNDEARQQQQQQETSAHEARQADTKQWRRCRSLLAASRCAQSVECRTSWRTHVCVASRDLSEITARRELVTEANKHFSLALSVFLPHACNGNGSLRVCDRFTGACSISLHMFCGRPAGPLVRPLSTPLHTACTSCQRSRRLFI